MNNIGRTEVILFALLIAAGMASGGYFVSQTLYNSTVAINTAQVKGLAERRVQADIVYWKIRYTVTGKNRAELAALYEESEAAQNTIITLLTANGLDVGEVKAGVVDYVRQEFRDENQALVEEKHLLVGSIDVETSNVLLVSNVRSKLNRLIAQGLDIGNDAPAYHFTQLNGIKPDMLREATKNARLAANEFAANAGVQVGGIRSARQGGFVIRDVGESYTDTASIEKEVRVVTNISFYLTD
ncbi:MAG: SIMPL domain-containing protein [Gammaproteobacteria bacterium]|nr:SIMPL domain-containing protein [Gammaproteobacteria bacterium]